MDQVRRQINAAMRFTMVISFPCTVGLAVLANPIFKMIFPGTAETAGIAWRNYSCVFCNVDTF